MDKAAKVYDFVFGIVIGASGALLAVGQGDAALVGAALAVVLRFTIGRRVFKGLGRDALRKAGEGGT